MNFTAMSAQIEVTQMRDRAPSVATEADVAS